MTAAEVTALLRRHPLRVSTEVHLHHSVLDVLTSADLDVQHEYRLAPGERIDFLVAGGIGIEAKARCDKRAIFRQLSRYAASDQITALILITGTPIGLPPTINDKPVFIVSTGRSAL